MYKIDHDMCGELCLSSTIAPYAVKFAGVKNGNCKDVGYAVKVAGPLLGKFEVSVYKKDWVMKIEWKKIYINYILIIYIKENKFKIFYYNFF